MFNKITQIFSFTGEFKSRLFLTITILIGLVREIGIIIFYSINDYTESHTFIWKFVLSFLFFMTSLLTIYYRTISDKEISSTGGSDNYLRDLFRVVFLIVFLFIISFFIEFSNLSLFLKFNYYDNNKPESLFTLIISEFYAYLLITLSFLVLHFLFKWFMIYRYKMTKKYLILIIYLIVYLFFMTFLTNELDFKYEIIANASNVAIFLISGILIWTMLQKHNWISNLSRNSKLKLIFISVLGIVISSLFISKIYEQQTFTDSSLTNFFNGSYALVSISFYFFDIYLARLFWMSVISLSSGNIVERKTSEITSLAFLNRFVSETVDKERNELISTMNNLALNSCRGHLAWTEIYNDKNEIEEIISNTIDKKSILKLHENKICHSVLVYLDNPYLAQSVPEHNEFFLFLNYIPQALSLMAVPIYSGNTRIGTLIVTNDEEFGFEQEDINVLSAFSDNVRLALENSRLVQDSLEKQKYKNELLLAHDIQKKLLPQSLPNLKNYSIDAFSYPATEVGGDYYDVIKLKNGNYCFLIADVSGKGISASFYMAQLKGIVMSQDRIADSPAHLLKIINKTLFGQMERQMYITISCLSIDDDTGNITLARAGHMPLFVKSQNRIKEYIPKGIGIGLTNHHFFNKNIFESKIKLNNNESCILFTDGINELRNKENNEFGYEPLKELLLKNNCNSKKIINDLLAETKKFSVGVEQHDDMSAIVICFNGK